MLQKISDMLEGREYRNETTDEIIELAKKHGVVIVFGYSDDNVEFEGAISEEIGCFQGTEIYIDKNGLIKECDDNCACYQRAKANAKVLNVRWCNDGYSWTYNFEYDDVDIETFEIFKDGEKYCKGIVFCLKDC